jgi:lysophospholipase L1-like esterase
MSSPKRVLALALFSAVLTFLPTADIAQAAERRFASEIRAFVDADRAQPPQRGGILFVGSSIFRLWTNVTEHMAPLPVRNRAFGGSRTGDQLDHFEQVVTPCAPKVIVYYCGSNDLKVGDEPEAIFKRFKAFSERVRREFPQTRLIFVSATRSPDRVAKWNLVDRYNALARGYCAGAPQHAFVDINPVLFDREGRPRRELYLKDELHFHPPAYEEFAAVIKPTLTRVWSETLPAATNSTASPR